MTIRLLSKRWLQRLMRAGSAWLLPETCCMCGFPGARAQFDLCAYCKRMLPANMGGNGCPDGFSRALVPFQYNYPVDHFIRALKFRGERHYARILGMLLAEAQLASGAPLPELLIPVPLHASRYRERGFNQAREIARFAARELGVRVDTSCITRVVATREQSALSLVDRRRNVSGAFSARAPRAQHVALIDDVLTTGNTAAEAARALHAAGIQKLELWAIAKVMGGGDSESSLR